MTKIAFFAKILFIVALCGKSVESRVIQTCTLFQLQGKNNELFSAKSGGSLLPGTFNLIGYSNPANSSVTSITKVVVVPSFLDSPKYTPYIFSGLPTIFSLNDAFSGYINLTLPVNLTSNRYRFALTLETDIGNCHYFTQDFATLDTRIDNCEIMDSQCQSDQGFFNCVLNPLGNTFSGELQLCGTGSNCFQFDNKAVCKLENSADISTQNPNNDDIICVPGKFECVENKFRQCMPSINQKGEFSILQSCPVTTKCVKSSVGISCI